jgi:hypothetical protein
MTSVNDWEELTAARLLDFFDARSRWHRGLWNPGLVLSLREILEAAAAVRASILSEPAIAFAIGNALKVASSDQGIGQRGRLKALQKALQGQVRFEGLDYLAIKQLIREIQSDYLATWATFLSDSKDRSNPERTSRAVASHLLDLGFNSDFLHRWFTYRLKHEAPKRPLPEVVMDAHDLAATPPQSFEAVVAFSAAPPAKFGRPDGWIDSRTVSQWLQQHGFSTAGVKQIGGVVLQLEARDGRAAAEAAVELIENLSARAAIATTGDLRNLPHVWVAGESSPYTIREHTRGVSIGALIREDVVYNKLRGEESIDAAFEMLAPLQGSSPIAAIASGWAAIEALLSEPNDRGGAADRLASIVACSYPRAELTALSYRLAREDVAMKAALAGVSENRDRARLVAEAITQGQPFALRDWSDRAAVRRVAHVLRRPNEMLNDVQTYVAVAFRRLYRQRNLVLHGGKTNAVALRACLRTASPLVGAGMDRIAHGYYVNKTTPLALAAQARTSLIRVDASEPMRTVDLLG